MIEQYWIDQFADLVNIEGIRPGKSNSAVATQITDAIKDHLHIATPADSKPMTSLQSDA